MTIRLLCSLLLALTVAACAPLAPDSVDLSDAAASTTPATEPTPLSTIVVGVDTAFEPFAFLDQSGALVGFDIDLINALSTKMGFEPAFVPTTFAALFSDLDTGELDAAVGAITITPARQERVAFTEPYFAGGLSPLSYFSAGQGLVVRTDSTSIAGGADLTRDVQVGVKRESTGAEYVATKSSATAVAYDEAGDALAALVNGDVDAVVLDTPVIIRFIKANPGAALKLVGGPLTSERYAIAVNRGRPDVLAVLNQGLDLIQQDGTYDDLFVKWFGAP